MKKYNIVITFLVLLSIAVSQNTVFWSSWDSQEIPELNSATWVITTEGNSKTIKEGLTEVETLKLEEKKNNIKLSKLKRVLNIEDFFKLDLNLEQKDNLRNIMAIYNNHKNELEKKLETESERLNETEEIINEVVENRMDIYKKLVPFVKTDKYKEYLEFIKEDIIILKENTGIKDDIYKKEVILKEKVDIIKEKIEEHEELLSQRLKDLITRKIDEKILSFTTNEKFIKLSKNEKEDVVKNIIFKTSSQIEKLEILENKTRIWVTKLQIYITIDEKLQKLLLEL